MDFRDGTLLREDGTDLLFVVIDGKLSVIENSDIFDASAATTVTPARLGAERGPAIRGDAYLATVDGKGYLVNNGERRFITGDETIRRYHFNRGKFQHRTSAELPAAGADLR